MNAIIVRTETGLHPALVGSGTHFDESAPGISGLVAKLLNNGLTPKPIVNTTIAFVDTRRAPKPLYHVMPQSTIFDDLARAISVASRGYFAVPTTVTPAPAAATKSSTPTPKSTAATKKSSTTTKKSSTTTSKSTATAKELAFLSDKNLSIEEKLYRFISLMTKKSDQELVDAMKQYEAKKAAASSSSSSSASSESKPSGGGGGGGPFGFIGDAVGGVVHALGDIGSKAVGIVESVTNELGGPVLAAAATAMGMPYLAPAAMSLGGGLAESAIETVVSNASLGTISGKKSSASSTSKSSSSSSSSTRSSSTQSSTATDSGEFDEKLEMFNLQRMVEKQDAMFAALSNVMKSLHDSQMTAVQNIR